jgi:hypothetical protein
MAKHQTTNYQFNYWDQFDEYPLFNATDAAANWTNLDALLKSGLGEDRLDTGWFKNGSYLPSTLKLGDGFLFPATGFQQMDSQTHYHEYDNRASWYPTAALKTNVGWDLGSSFGKILLIFGGINWGPYSITKGGIWVSNVKPPTQVSGSSIPQSAYHGLTQNFKFSVSKTDGSGTFTELKNDQDTEGNTYQDNAASHPSYQSQGYALYADGTNVRLFIRKAETGWTKVVDIADATFSSFRYCGFYGEATSTMLAWIQGPVAAYAQ